MKQQEPRVSDHCLSQYRTIQTVLSWFKPEFGSDVYVEVIYADSIQWSGWISQERWEQIQQEELDSELAELNAPAAYSTRA